MNRTGFRVSGLGFRGSGFRVSGLGFRVVNPKALKPESPKGQKPLEPQTEKQKT